MYHQVQSEYPFKSDSVAIHLSNNCMLHCALDYFPNSFCTQKAGLSTCTEVVTRVKAMRNVQSLNLCSCLDGHYTT